jgi:hypothetical protein
MRIKLTKVFPGEFAGASLKLRDRVAHGRIGQDFPGESAGASLKRR